MDTLYQYITKTFDDKKLSSSEKKALLQAIEESRLDTNQRNLLRSRVFDFARDQIDGFENSKVLDWLESINKLLVSGIAPVKNDVFFSPGLECRGAIIESIRNARSTMHICVFTISDNDIAYEIIRSYKRGTDIKIITDDEKTADFGSDIIKFADAGIPVKIDNSQAHMHHKFAVIDKSKVITGSYNWTKSAYNQNQENILITDHPGAVTRYLTEFTKLWEKMKNY